MKKSLLFFVITLSITHSAFAQLQGQQLIDSLRAQIPLAAEDTNKVIMLYNISFTYYSINTDSGLKYGNEALTLSQKLNWKQGIANSKGRIGVNYFGKADYPKALEYWLQALKINEELQNKKAIGINLGNIGNVYLTKADYPKALEYYIRAVKLNEETGNKNAMSLNLGNIGTVYGSQNDFVKAEEYFLKALHLCEELGDQGGVARNVISLGNVYMMQKNYEKAVEYEMEALKMTKEAGNNSLTAITLVNLGKTYKDLAKDTTAAYKLLAVSKNIALQKAKVYTDSAIITFREIGDVSGLFQGYLSLSEIQELQEDNKGSLESYKNYTLFKDSVFNMEKDKNITEQAMQYEFDKKQAAQKAEQDKKDIEQRNVRNSFMICAAFLFILLILAVNRYRFKQKANKELAAAYENLKAAQQQLIQSEKMAAFGAMASRMAHEIQNPLNFVNNFSELSQDLVEDVVNPASENVKKEAANTLVSNLQKINHHGKRAEDIIRQLQEHARKGTSHEFFSAS